MKKNLKLKKEDPNVTSSIISSVITRIHKYIPTVKHSREHWIIVTRNCTTTLFQKNKIITIHNNLT